MMSSTECEKYEAEEMQRRILTRERDWHHKRQLDKLPTFTEKIDYWRKEVFKEKNTASAAWVYDAIPDSNISFRLDLDPQTAEERQLLFNFQIECDRIHLAQERYSVEKFVYDDQKDGYDKIAFYVELLDDRKADLSNRLITAIHKRDLVKAELKAVTDALESATRTVNGFNGYYFNEIQHMRQCLALNKPFNFGIKGHKFCSTEAIGIAVVWDIVHYEYFLQNEIAKWDDNPQLIERQQTPQKTSGGKERNSETAIRAITILNTEIKRVINEFHGSTRPSNKELVGRSITAYASRIKQAGLYGQSEKSLSRYLKDLGLQKTPKQYIESKIRDTLSDKM